MDKKQSLSFCYKGNRDYVHGTDIFNVTLSEIVKTTQKSKFDSIDMAIRKVSRNNMMLYYAKQYSDGIPDQNVAFTIKSDETNLRLALVENDDPVECNYPYPEEVIIKAAKFDGSNRTIELKSVVPFSLIEKIVALNKALLNNLFPDVSGKWYFARIKLTAVNWEQWKNENPEIILQLKKNMQFKITDTLLFLDKEECGHIYFSLVKNNN